MELNTTEHWFPMWFLVTARKILWFVKAIRAVPSLREPYSHILQRQKKMYEKICNWEQVERAYINKQAENIMEMNQEWKQKIHG